ncbi:MAG: hypothetical protein AAF720_03475 [Pseudomonadota bacterium]
MIWFTGDLWEDFCRGLIIGFTIILSMNAIDILFYGGAQIPDNDQSAVSEYVCRLFMEDSSFYGTPWIPFIALSLALLAKFGFWRLGLDHFLTRIVFAPLIFPLYLLLVFGSTVAGAYLSELLSLLVSVVFDECPFQ